jgi:hypothetical protein
VQDSVWADAAEARNSIETSATRLATANRRVRRDRDSDTGTANGSKTAVLVASTVLIREKKSSGK